MTEQSTRRPFKDHWEQVKCRLGFHHFQEMNLQIYARKFRHTHSKPQVSNSDSFKACSRCGELHWLDRNADTGENDD